MHVEVGKRKEKKNPTLCPENIKICEGKLCALGVWRSVRGKSLHMDNVSIWLMGSGSIDFQVFVEQDMILSFEKI